jgi:enamine deaminase RidA (YjgF/YER057c/UK114 family)
MARQGLSIPERFRPDAVFPEVVPKGRSGLFELQESNRWRVGVASVPGRAALAEAVQRIYRDLLLAAEGMHLCRIWNFIPDINGRTESGLERYQAFSKARSLAFEERFGPDFRRRLPAASAVGAGGDKVVVWFVAASREATHIENPRQVPAYDYPPEYGPRPPSFSRATLVSADGATDIFVSGTSAVVGSGTVAPNDTRAQLECTLENLAAVSGACGLGPDLGGGRAALRQFSVYLRHPEDQSWVLADLEERLFGVGDRVSAARADICRAELNIEIEVTLRGVRAG